ncbi:hypothetical protein ACIPSH_32295, partial [Streptomyces iakyrus]|uniref:hypothetical protein n=1 Tax=Streptomyces iakyrus TaxID=68219 RepID=UPI0037F2518C
MCDGLVPACRLALADRLRPADHATAGTVLVSATVSLGPAVAAAGRYGSDQVASWPLAGLSRHAGRRRAQSGRSADSRSSCSASARRA